MVGIGLTQLSRLPWVGGWVAVKSGIRLSSTQLGLEAGALAELGNKYDFYFTTIFFSLSRRVFSISSSTLPSPSPYKNKHILYYII